MVQKFLVLNFYKCTWAKLMEIGLLHVRFPSIQPAQEAAITGVRPRPQPKTLC